MRRTLCRAAHKLDREYLWHFFDEPSSGEAAVDEVSAARGADRCAATSRGRAMTS
jgi:hypothetical protein